MNKLPFHQVLCTRRQYFQLRVHADAYKNGEIEYNEYIERITRIVPDIKRGHDNVIRIRGTNKLREQRHDI